MATTQFKQPAMNLVIIDAMNLIRRVHATQPDQNELSQTLHQSVRSLNKIIAASAPSHILAVFDRYDLNTQQESSQKITADNWRSALIPEYKQDRTPPSFELINYLDTIQEAFWKEGVDSLDANTDEANDLIATIAVKATYHKLPTTIISTDKSYCQLLSKIESPYLKIRDYFQKRWLDHLFVENYFGVRCEQLTDFWSLVGIPSLKISGIPGVGAKTAAEMLQQYENIETLFSEAFLIEKWAKRLRNKQEIAFITKQVVTLKTDIPLGFSLKDIRFRSDIKENKNNLKNDIKNDKST